MKRVMISGTQSGVGKTTISMGLMAALCQKGYKVAPFKVGPDYIDPGFHRFVTKQPSYNLDSYLLEENMLCDVMVRTLQKVDIGIVEGVMGLYDGLGSHSMIASSAHVAILTQTPVLLVIDGKGISTSAAAMVLGYKTLNPAVNIAGIIVNRVSGAAHYQIIKAAIENLVGIPCVGYFPKDTNISLNSRHLGLIPAEEVDQLSEHITRLAEIIEQTVDLSAIIAISAQAPPLKISSKHQLKAFINDNRSLFEGKRFGIAKDKAFSFYYQQNLELLRLLGVELVPFSPLHDKYLPEALDALYIGGGFPEIFASQLEANHSFRVDLKNRLTEGMICYAECGGLMYLSEGITTLEGQKYHMVGFIPTWSEMTKRLQRFGYVEVEAHFKDKPCMVRAHEFHRSKIEEREGLEYLYRVIKRRDGVLSKEWRCGVHKWNTLAGYPHVHFLSNPEFMRNVFIKGASRHVKIPE